MLKYFVAFDVGKNGTSGGKGNGEINVSDKINSYEDILEMEKTLLEKHSQKCDWLKISNYILL